MTEVAASPAQVTSITYQGGEFPVSEMTVFPTGQGCLPYVYLTAKGIFFLQTHRAQWETPRVRRIPRHEAARIANLYNVEALKQALHHSAGDGLVSSATAGATVSDAELIRQVNELTPEQLDRLSHVLQGAGLK